MEAKSLTSADIPSHLLKAAYLVGKIPFRACKSDPRISFSLYIPSGHYEAVHTSLQQSRPVADKLPLIVNLHGTRRDAVTPRDSLIDFADSHGVAVLAPLFPAGLDDYMDLDSYKLLRSKTLKADLVLLSILDEVKHIWPGISTEKIILVGHSGGAHFVHRFMYLHAERLSAVLVASPGSTTKLSDRLWPEGIGDYDTVFGGRRVDVDAIRDIKHLKLIVGEGDNEVSDIVALQSWLAQRRGSGSAKTAKKRLGRVEGLRELQENWRDHAIESDLEIVPGVAHAYLGLLPAILRWLEGVVPVLQEQA